MPPRKPHFVVAPREGSALSQPAVFSSFSEAKAAADAHLRDGFSRASTRRDDLKWFESGEITISGTLDGELDPIVFPSHLSDHEKDQIREVAHIRFLERAIGIATVNVLMSQTIKRENHRTIKE